jgi:hypothetical protein
MAAPARIRATTLEEDREILQAIADMGDYAPINAAHSPAALQELEADLTWAEQEEGRARRAYELARDRAMAAARRFHDAVLSAKAQVVVQYGPDSPALKAIGLKRKSEYKRPPRRRPRVAE